MIASEVVAFFVKLTETAPFCIVCLPRESIIIIAIPQKRMHALTIDCSE